MAPVNDSEDPFDVITDEPNLGIIVRTDFSDETAWSVFLQRLHDEESELINSSSSSNEAAEAGSDAMDEDESDDEGFGGRSDNDEHFGGGSDAGEYGGGYGEFEDDY